MGAAFLAASVSVLSAVLFWQLPWLPTARGGGLESLPDFPVPVRSAQAKALARSCVHFHGENGARVYFLHNRKAGGTTVRKWLGYQQICQGRFTGFVEEATVFNVSRLCEQGTLFVTALRDPVSRIKSSYKFEGEGTFAQWLVKVQKERTMGHKGRIWMEVQNYYVQRLSGYRWKGLGPSWPRGRADGDESAPDWRRLFERALAVLESFDVVFIVEEMDRRETLRAGAMQLGLRDFAERADLGHERVRRYTRGPVPVLNLTATEEATLAEWNAWDTKLFAAARARAAADAESLAVLTSPGVAPSANNCAGDMRSKWGEPLERQRQKLTCRRRQAGDGKARHATVRNSGDLARRA